MDIKVYGHDGCPDYESACKFLHSSHAHVQRCDISLSQPSPQVIRRAAALNSGRVLSDRAGASAAEEAPTLVVRGGRVIVGANPLSIQSLMY